MMLVYVALSFLAKRAVWILIPDSRWSSPGVENSFSNADEEVTRRVNKENAE
jgi:hypothetical protein